MADAKITWAWEQEGEDLGKSIKRDTAHLKEMQKTAKETERQLKGSDQELVKRKKEVLNTQKALLDADKKIASAEKKIKEIGAQKESANLSISKAERSIQTKEEQKKWLAQDHKKAIEKAYEARTPEASAHYLDVAQKKQEQWDRANDAQAHLNKQIELTKEKMNQLSAEEKQQVELIQKQVLLKEKLTGDLTFGLQKYDLEKQINDDLVEGHKQQVQQIDAEARSLREEQKEYEKIQEAQKKTKENAKAQNKSTKSSHGLVKKGLKPFGFLQRRIDKIRQSFKFLGFQMKTALLWGVVLMPLMKAFDVLRDNLMAVTKQNSAFTASLANLKGTLWTATAPALLAITDVLTAFMNKLAYVITYISTFVNALFGLSKVSKKTVKNMASAKDKVKGGGGKDKGLSLASWDTVQQLQKPSGGGGSGEDEDVIPPTFDQDFSDAENALEKFKKLLSEEGWYGVGQALTNSLNSVLLTFDNWLSHDFWQAITNFSAQFADFLNGAMDGLDWGLLGKTVGDGLLAIIDAIDIFLATFSAIDLGKSIAKFFTGIDWIPLISSIGSLLKNALLFLPKMLIGFIEGIDWTEVPGALFDSIVAFFEGFDVADVMAVIGELIGALIKGAFDLVFGLTSEVTSWIWEKASGMGENIGDGIGSGLISWIGGIVTWIKENIFQPFIDGFKKVFGIHSPSKEMEPIGDYIGQGILEGLLKPFKNIRDWLNEHIFLPIWEGICKVFGIDANDSEKMEEIGGALSNGLTGGFEAAVEKVKSVLNKIISAVETAMNWIIKKLNKLHVDAPDWMKDKFGVEGVGFDFKEINIPRLAQGGVVNPGHQFAAILGDNRREQEIVSPLSTMKEALMEALRDSGAYHSGNITLQIDGQTFARITNPYLQNETNRIGIVATGG